jgi:hypothetical protein
MTTDSRGAGGAAGRATCGRAARRIAVRPSIVIRSLLLAAWVFTVAALTGALLSGAAPAAPAEPAGEAGTGRPPAAGPSPDPLTETFARSMIYTGSAGLAVSISGLVLVSRRRRLW